MHKGASHGLMSILHVQEMWATFQLFWWQRCVRTSPQQWQMQWPLGGATSWALPMWYSPCGWRVSMLICITVSDSPLLPWPLALDLPAEYCVVWCTFIGGTSGVCSLRGCRAVPVFSGICPSQAITRDVGGMSGLHYITSR